MERVRVAVGVICQGRQLLLSKRRQDAHQGGLWEFPGGKIESGETAGTALHRELQEELGIQVQCSEPLLEVRHDYADRQVSLEARWVSQFSGQVVAREGQPLRWVSATQLCEIDFPAANRPIVAAALKLLPGASGR